MDVPRETVRLLTTLGVSRETKRLTQFVDLLIRWNSRINLVSAPDIHTLWWRHVADSLQLIPFFPDPLASAIDLGSGGGFPGLALAIATGVPFTLVEADRRKAAFLAEAARLCQAPVIIKSCRIEACSIEPAQLVTSRALAPLPKLLSLAFPLLAQSGVCLFLKGQMAKTELEDAAASWAMTVERHESITDPNGTVLRISKVARA